MAKKILSEEVIVDSDDGFTDDSDVERELEENAITFKAPRKYSKINDKLQKPQIIHKDSKIWLFKFPKDMDLTKLKSIPLKEESEFSISDKLYSIHEESTNNNSLKQKFKILLPEESNLKNDNKNIKISRFFDISEKVVIPEINYSKVVIPRVDVEKEEDLRMRHFPTGYYIKDFEEAKEPVIPGSQSKKRSRDANSDEAKDDSKESKKKSKKDKKEKKEKKEKKDKKSKKKD